MRLIEELKAIRALIDTPEKWTQDVFARDKSGDKVSSKDPVAVCYCLAGAERIVCLNGDAAYDALVDAMPDDFDDLPDFNDHHGTTHADVMALIDRTIEAEQIWENM